MSHELREQPACEVEFFYEPTVYLIAEPRIRWDAVEAMLRAEMGLPGGVAWASSKQPGAALTVSPGTVDSEAICEVLGRLCYDSFGEAQGRVGSEAYLGHILESGHGSLLENATFTFVVCRASRGYTHQQVRHRAGWGYAQASTHFIDYSKRARLCLVGLAEDARAEAETGLRQALGAYGRVWDMMAKAPADGAGRAKKKAVCAAVRSMLPTALESKIGCTANLRAIRHFLELRGAKDNVPEIRLVAAKLLPLVRASAPVIFGDFEESVGDDGFPVLTCKYHKV